MADGRRNNGGHSTKGFAGRKPKADEIKLIEKLDSIIDKDAVIQKMLEMIEDDNFPALKLYMEYRFGKPKETVHNTHEFAKGIEDIKELYAKATKK